MFLNFGQLKSELLNRLKTNNSLVSNSRMGTWLNLAQDDVATEVEPDHLIKPILFSTVASTRKYYLDFEFNKILNVVDTSNDMALTQKFEAQVEVWDPNFDEGGTPVFFSTYGYEWVRAQPLTASTISIVSSETTDLTQKVRIRGLVDGVEDTEILTLDGTTIATGLKVFSEVFTAAKDEITSGKVTVTANDASTTEIAIFSPSFLHDSKQPLFLWPTPDGVYNMYVRGVRRPRRMVSAEDFPDYPEAYHELILHKATERGHKDLMRPTMAQFVRQNDYEPMKDKLVKEMGQRRGPNSPVLSGSSQFFVKGGRLGNRFGD